MNQMTRLAPADSNDSQREAEGVGEIVAFLFEKLASGSCIFMARDEPRARHVAQALQAGAGDHRVVFCPGSDALPGDKSPPTPANAGQRTSALRSLRLAAEGEVHVALITTGESCARLYPPPSAYDTAPPVLTCGDELNFTELGAMLEGIGYFADERVDEPGEFAVRGNVIDIYPADAGGPCRIEVADGAIVSIRAYDAITQLTLDSCESLEIGRAREPDIEGGVALLDHLPGAPLLVEHGADKRRVTFLDLAADAAERGDRSSLRGVCMPERWDKSVASRSVKSLGAEFGEPPARYAEAGNPLQAFSREAKAALSDSKIVLLGTRRDLRFLVPRVARTLKSKAREVQSWAEVDAAAVGSLLVLAMPVPRGFRLGDIMAVAAADLLGSRAQREESEGLHAELDPFQLGELRRGDVVVHQDHGLSVVEGLEAAPDGGDALVLRFAGEARRLVPASEANRIWRYGSDEDAVTLDKLDGSSWEKRRGEVEIALEETARELAKLAAERREREAAVLEPDPARYERFVDGFPFTETADQARAINAVRDDLASGRPMDRLVVGDVGYGKTEVALRAAAIVVLAGKQVALAVPTTVLARQHLESFTKRFKGMGIKVAGLSRLSSAAEKKAVKQGLADGSVSIVIGTGAIAGKGVAYADLGLVIVDEEQRFGAADKAKLAGLGADQILTLSATPIPRTLQSALVGLQQLSIIATPPARRQPIRSTVASFDDAQVRLALLRERSRGGQSFVVVPRIEDLAGLAERLARLVPEMTVLQAHGKLPAADLDETMVRFAAGDGDVLLATNIIEAGLDVPRANTMIVWRADRFGLSQLHQLRGRVGRGSRRGHILLLTDPQAQIPPRTLARLNTLSAFDRLGAGFAISARDLDMRGAGDLLGEEQAGHAKLIGVELYQHLLELAIARAHGDAVDDWSPVLNVGLSGTLPESWIPDLDLRITLHARLSRIGDVSGLEQFEQELVDRFGELPAEAAALMAIARLRVLARSVGIERLDAGPAAIALTPRRGHKPRFKEAGLIRSDERYLCKDDFTDPQARLARAEEILSSLA
ncbi:transcription-repair coupling factor (superfamily II helicase) [Novosphingobium chloroacetimidivorans]|uniref:Transcription-repair-coupling factor n=1 Tax=Novosphingobium chloroacetimidivorans TaxID=1428314 RepID=A0A7W7K6V6_9SPHN|nr:helicase-related protein [Novosphingobium chloroacetimidivorans]MBB4856809.1 transcription-repair coupling factor (superfamily II helicase) [Novosphingobium chloroacetimidivorans]